MLGQLNTDCFSELGFISRTLRSTNYCDEHFPLLLSEFGKRAGIIWVGWSIPSNHALSRTPGYPNRSNYIINKGHKPLV
jgi:hypothetical protein